MARYRVGIVGCGEVTQILHLPALYFLEELFEIASVCDASAVVADAVSRQCGPMVKVYGDYHDLVADAAIDIVLVACPDIYHYDVAAAAMRAGKHVLIEKPMCMTLAEADALQAVQDESGVLVQVGYMRRFADAYLEARRLLDGARDDIRFARVHDFFGAPAAVTNSTSRVIRPTDLSAAIQAELRDIRVQKIREATGSDDPRVQMSYSVLLGLSTHDISAMRELLGQPSGLLYATHRHDGRNINAAFDYGSFVCEFATGMDELPRFDTFIEVYAQSSVMRLDYETPYVRNLPAQLTVQRANTATGLSRATTFGARTDTFVAEWRAFHDSLAAGVAPKTSIADSRADLEIFAMIMQAITAAAAQGDAVL